MANEAVLGWIDGAIIFMFVLEVIYIIGSNFLGGVKGFSFGGLRGGGGGGGWGGGGGGGNNNNDIVKYERRVEEGERSSAKDIAALRKDLGLIANELNTLSAANAERDKLLAEQRELIEKLMQTADPKIFQELSEKLTQNEERLAKLENVKKTTAGAGRKTAVATRNKAAQTVNNLTAEFNIITGQEVKASQVLGGAKEAAISHQQKAEARVQVEGAKRVKTEAEQMEQALARVENNSDTAEQLHKRLAGLFRVYSKGKRPTQQEIRDMEYKVQLSYNETLQIRQAGNLDESELQQLNDQAAREAAQEVALSRQVAQQEAVVENEEAVRERRIAGGSLSR